MFEEVVLLNTLKIYIWKILFTEFLAELYFEVSTAVKPEVRGVSLSVPKAPFWVLQALVEFQVLSIKIKTRAKRQLLPHSETTVQCDLKSLRNKTPCASTLQQTVKRTPISFTFLALCVFMIKSSGNILNPIVPTGYIQLTHNFKWEFQHLGTRFCTTCWLSCSKPRKRQW